MRATALLAMALAAAACAAPDAPRAVIELPVANEVRDGGTQLRTRIDGLALADREVVLWQEFERGNVPAFLGRLVPVTTSAIVDGTVRTARFWVAPDWFGFGTEADWFR
ncbi:MAG: hypothetical protein RIT25_1826, partial [Planctomycetota bacterium]